MSDSVVEKRSYKRVSIPRLVLIANANLPSYDEMRRFKEHATILLVSGVFILLAAGLDFGELDLLVGRQVLAAE